MKITHSCCRKGAYVLQKEKERTFENEWEKNKELEDEDISRRE